MEKKNIRTKIVLAITLGIIISASLFVIFNYKRWITESRANVEIVITDLYFKPSVYGNGRTLYLNITIKNKANSTNSWIYLPYVVTDKNKKHICMFDSPVEIPPYGSINVTVHTYDSEAVCDPLSLDEIPKKFGYHIDVVEPFPPVSFEIDIPEDLVMSASTS
ncbi:MAG TPA: hypothetical protein ENG74_03845 [Thermoplasmatales archaeon]|nr:hypothetical protein [Thermoplasmatales archaeon]